MLLLRKWEERERERERENCGELWRFSGGKKKKLNALSFSLCEADGGVVFSFVI